MSSDNWRDAVPIVRAVLAADLACTEQALIDEGLTVTLAEERAGRRRFPPTSRPLHIVTMGAGVVASCHPERVDWLRAALGKLHRNDVFASTTIAKLAQYVERDRQLLRGPELRYVCSQADVRPVGAPEDVEIAVVEGTDIPQLYRHREFPNALAYRRDTPRPDVVATVATRAGEIVGVAGASADCDAMWQIGVDVVAEARGRGVGRALVARLTREVLRMGRLPYYSTTVSNIPSRALAIGVGYRPGWVELYAKDQ